MDVKSFSHDPRPQKISTVGFMGARSGLTESQKQALADLLHHLAPGEVHHGDCIGADAQFHDLVVQGVPQAVIVVHPPVSEEFRAFKRGHICHESREYLLRDRDVVARCDLLIAAPSTFEPVERSGTWATVEFARCAGKGVVLVFPDGTVTSDLPLASDPVPARPNSDDAA